MKKSKSRLTGQCGAAPSLAPINKSMGNTRSRTGTGSPIDPLKLRNNRPIDIEGQAIIARAHRIATCEREVWEALAPILQRHHCRLGTVQEIIDGQAGAVRIVVFANDG
jgi:hypothetical protein